jgi:hypothetical protein
VRRTKAPEATPFSKYTLLVPFEVFSLEVNFAVRRTLVPFRLDCSSAAIQRAPLSIIAVTELSVRTSGPQQGRTSILPKSQPILVLLHPTFPPRIPSNLSSLIASKAITSILLFNYGFAEYVDQWAINPVQLPRRRSGTPSIWSRCELSNLRTVGNLLRICASCECFPAGLWLKGKCLESPGHWR